MIDGDILHNYYSILSAFDGDSTCKLRWSSDPSACLEDYLVREHGLEVPQTSGKLVGSTLCGASRSLLSRGSENSISGSNCVSDLAGLSLASCLSNRIYQLEDVYMYKAKHGSSSIRMLILPH